MSGMLQRLRSRIPSSRDLMWFTLASVGFAGCLMLTGTFDTVLATNCDVASFDFRVAGYPLPGNAPVVVVCAVLALLAWTMRGVRLTRALALALAVGQLVSVVVLFLTRWAGLGLLPQLAWVLLAACSTVQVALEAQVLTTMGRIRALVAFAVAILLDALFDMMASVLPPAATEVLLIGFSMGSPLILVLVKEAMEAPQGLFGGASEQNGGTPVDALPLPLSIAVTALYGIAMGLVQGMGTGVLGEGGTLAMPVIPLALACCAIAVMVFALAFERLGNPDALLRVVVLLVLLAAVYLAGLLGRDGLTAGVVAMSLTRVAAFTYLWLLACEALPHPTRALFVFAMGWGAFTLAQTLSTQAALATSATVGGYAAYQVAVVASLLLLVLANFYPQLVRRSPITESIGSTDADPAVADRDPTRDAGVAALDSRSGKFEHRGLARRGDRDCAHPYQAHLPKDRHP